MFKKIFNHKIIKTNKNVEVIGLNKKIQASYVWNLFNTTKKDIIIVTNSLYEANNIYKSLYCYNEQLILFFPMDDFLVSESLAISPDLMVKRIETLNEILQNKEKKIIVTNLMGYLRFLPTKKLWNESKLNITLNLNIKREELINKLNSIGYKKETIVTKTGEYSNRGYILDIFPFGYENPVRVEFFDDVIDEIRYFNPNNQLSNEKIDNVIIFPFTEFINEKNIDEIDNRQSLLPRVVNEVSKLDEYLDNPLIVYSNLDEIKISYKKILEDILEFSQADKYKINSYMHNLIEILPNNYVNISTTNNYLLSGEIEKYESSEIDKFNSNFNLINEFLIKMLNKKKKIIVLLDNEAMISDFMSKVKLETVITDISNIFDDKINIIKNKIAEGFIVDNFVFLSANEIYNKENIINYKNKFKYGSKIKDINKLKVGDYIVHSSFGIGRYLGIVTLNTKGLSKDYIHLQYKDKDKLYVPVEKIECISKYSSNEGFVPKLNKLGGTDWEKQKARVKSKVKDIAKQLLETSALRKLSSGFAFFKDDEEQIIFENNFSYEATTDQLKASTEIKNDMEKPFPMDRLLCGDVGFGKTEVAFRAIFKAIKSGKQVAFLCPTTILSKQHYENALKRFEGFGVNISVLNRFVTPKEKKQILSELKSGKIDLIIGTHRLLSGDILYKDLGLLVIDEEQRFGVTHKEKIKSIKKNIDVLTLSATPIPRTLQMSLTGIRGLSLIETPPTFRYPIQTYVLRENDHIIKDAIYKELSRNGQVFILYNNISKIENQVTRIKNLVPESNIAYIHGRMQKNEIENKMESFINGEYNVLVCTTIIETGIDIQNANTLIIFDADCFGLSQLYQIRGRIGRGKNIAYAYLMYNKNKELSDIAVKRLDAIKEFTELGSGYALAVRDLSIRGAGDILGAEQSGFIDSIGYDMYLKILNEEVELLKGNKVIEKEENDEKPFIQVNTHINDFYADNEDLKIDIHKAINTIDSKEQYYIVKAELEDRFGKLSEDIIIYMLEELFQSLAKKKGISKVEQLPNKIIMYFSLEKTKKIDGTKLLKNLFDININFSVTYKNNNLIVSLLTNDLNKHFLYYLVEMINIIE